MDGNRSLTAQTLSALGWRLGALASKLILQVGVMAILARLLPVSAFGLLGQAMVVIGLTLVISEIGMAPVLIHKQDLTEFHRRVAYTLSLLMGLFLMGVVWGAAPFLASLLANVDLIPILKALSPLLLFASLNATATALLQRELNFRGLFFTELGAYAIGYVGVGVSLAFLGYGVWALVFAALSQAALSLIAVALIAPTPVRFGLHRAETRSLISLAGGMSVVRLLLYAARNMDYALVGRGLGPEALGFYTRAYMLMVIPITQLSGASNMVLAPAYAKIQNDIARLRRAYYDNLAAASLAVFPALAWIVVMAPELIVVLFGEKWRLSIVPLQFLATAGAFLCIHNIGDALGRALGNVGGRLWRYVVYNILVFLFVLLGLPWGINGAACGMIVALAIQYLLMAHLTIQLTAGSWREFFRAQSLGVFLSLLIAATALSTSAPLRAIECPKPLTLLATMISCAVVGACVLFTVPNHWLPTVAVSLFSRVEANVVRLSRRLSGVILFSSNSVKPR